MSFRNMENMASQSVLSIDALNEFVVSNVLLDNRMSILHQKIKLKKQDINQIQQEIMWEKETANKLNIEIEESKASLEKAGKTIQGLLDARISIENLYVNAVKQLETARQNNIETDSERKKIIEKFTNIKGRYLNTYNNLNLNKKKNDKKLEIKANQIKLKETRRDYEEYRRKANILESITDLILKKKILRFADLMISRNKYIRDIDAQININRKLREEVEKLSQREEPKYEKRSKTEATITLLKIPTSSLTMNTFMPIKERLGIRDRSTFSSFSSENTSNVSTFIKYHGIKDKSVTIEKVKKQDLKPFVQEIQTKENQNKGIKQILRPLSQQNIQEETNKLKQNVKAFSQELINQNQPEMAQIEKWDLSPPLKTRKTIKNNEIPKKTVTFQQQDIDENNSFMELESPKAQSSPLENENKSSGLFTPMYNFPAGASMSIVSPEPFSVNSADKDFSSLFGISTQKKDEKTSFFNLF